MILQAMHQQKRRLSFVIWFYNECLLVYESLTI